MIGGRRPAWFPGRRLMALEYYLRLVMRYGVGGGGVAWELVGDHGKNPLVLLIAAMLATSTDVLGLVRGLIAQAKMERKTLEEMIAEETRRERGEVNREAGESYREEGEVRREASERPRREEGRTEE